MNWLTQVYTYNVSIVSADKVYYIYCKHPDAHCQKTSFEVHHVMPNTWCT